MGPITHLLLQSFRKVHVARNKWGDFLKETVSYLPCRIRYISQLDKNVNREAVQSVDSIIWFESGASIDVGDIGEVDGQYWRIDRLIKARTMHSSSIQFLKCEATIYELSDIS